MARQIGAPRTMRAGAQACATDHLAIASPCHRVMHRDGNLSGHRWGVARKRELPQHETAGGYPHWE
ncbi:MAG: methylated-DNA--[protein]-cysteine S-methyltransferase [Burkholderiaceae bacterium]|nr:MAG: methylated-DNA--[protein]-cysteine S-methyltransferase [Burkholderiaceae bacterium]